MSVPRCLIAGCGDVGSRLGVLLADRGWHSFGMRRRTERVPPPITAVAGDLTDPASLTDLPGDLDTLVFIAAPMVRTLETYRKTYLEGPRHLLAALGEQTRRLRRAIFVSSTSVYGDSGGQWVDERTSPRPQAFNGEIVLEAERLWARSGLPLTVVRLAGLYGPDRLWMIRRVQEVGATCQDDPPLWTNRIHVEDAARMLAHIIELDAPRPLYLGVDDEPATECAVMHWLAERLGVPEPRPASEPVRHGPLGNKRLSNRLIRATGFEFMYPTFREGYAAVIAALPPGRGGTSEQETA
ncbi:MAG TPA: SDR family oxidoreductase [Xanthomonadaceae bacterium]|nr:SDR family oxidoreductase [Xanthomonadaceae bacterium]